MANTRFTCTLTTTDQPACTSYARVTITDSGGDTARGCPPPCCRRARRHHRSPRGLGRLPGAQTSTSARPWSCPRSAASSRQATG